VFEGRYNEDRISLVFTNGKTNKIKTAAKSAKTPNNLFGIERKIA
jgi:hypothetical protein